MSSGGISQLVAIGAQDAFIVGKPEVSFFQSAYKQHTNFSQVVDRQLIQGTVTNQGMSSVRFERSGDMLGYIYLVPIISVGGVIFFPVIAVSILFSGRFLSFGHFF